MASTSTSASPGDGGDHQVIPNGVRIKGWEITAQVNEPILNSRELETLQSDLHLEKLPDMIFGKNFIKFAHLESLFEFNFNAIDGVKGIGDVADYAHIKVSHSDKWANTRESLSDYLQKSYNWTFSTNYKGSIISKGVPMGDEKFVVPTNENIDIKKLQAQDPIYYYNQTHLFEDELGDNGVSLLSARVRVMPHRFFALMRFWLRVDHVIYRVYDTRIYHEFGKDYLLREYQYREGPYEPLKQLFDKERNKMHDENTIVPLLPVLETYTQQINFNSQQ